MVKLSHDDPREHCQAIKALSFDLDKGQQPSSPGGLVTFVSSGGATLAWSGLPHLAQLTKVFEVSHQSSLYALLYQDFVARTDHVNYPNFHFLLTFQDFPFCAGFNAPTVFLPDYTAENVRLLLKLISGGEINNVTKAESYQIFELINTLGMVSLKGAYCVKSDLNYSSSIG